MSTFCVDRAATSKALAAEHASHAASMRETENAWTITKSVAVETFAAAHEFEGTVSVC